MFDGNFGLGKKTYSYVFFLTLILIAILAIATVYSKMSHADNAALNTRGHLDQFDASITHFFNQFATQNVYLDNFLVELSDNQLLKGGFTVGIILYLWFSCDDPEDERRGSLIVTLLFAVMGVLLVRFMAHFLPFRDRPVNTSAMHFIIPSGVEASDFITWSSFPSDHAALFFSLATGIYLVSRRWGIAALLHALIIICLPRLYLGIHWTTDLLVGGVVGAFMALLGNLPFIRHFVHRVILRIAHYNRALFYTGLFLFCYEVISLFDDVRHIVVIIARIFIHHS